MQIFYLNCLHISFFICNFAYIKFNINMEQNTANIVKNIAFIQIEALKKLLNKENQKAFSEDELCKLFQVKPEELNQAIQNHLNLYEDMVQMPEMINILNEYQTSLCSYILWKMESEWVIDNQEGVLGAWSIITTAQRKFHPEYKIIL